MTGPNGFIKDYGYLYQSKWFKMKDPSCLKVYMVFIQNANWAPSFLNEKYAKKLIVRRGQALYGIPFLCKETGLTEWEVRLAIKSLKQDLEITTTPYNKFSIVTLLKYEEIVGGKTEQENTDELVETKSKMLRNSLIMEKTLRHQNDKKDDFLSGTATIDNTGVSGHLDHISLRHQNEPKNDFLSTSKTCLTEGSIPSTVDVSNIDGSNIKVSNQSYNNTANLSPATRSCNIELNSPPQQDLVSAKELSMSIDPKYVPTHENMKPYPIRWREDQTIGESSSEPVVMLVEDITAEFIGELVHKEVAYLITSATGKSPLRKV